jgi:ketosteroid isomerase-like protein
MFSSLRPIARRAVSPRYLATKAEDELINVNRSLLTAISSGDWKKYAELVSADATCIEPETSKQIVSGLEFHKFYFDLPGDPTVKQEPKNTTMSDIHAKVVGSLGYLTYNRVTQVGLKTNVAQETRCWEKNKEGQWKMTHFHKSV